MFPFIVKTDMHCSVNFESVPMSEESHSQCLTIFSIWVREVDIVSILRPQIWVFCILAVGERPSVAS